MRIATMCLLTLIVTAPLACIADSLEDAYPTPESWSKFHLRSVATRVETHRARTGEWPRSLDDVIPAEHRRDVRGLSYDGWQELIAYTPGGLCAELRSKGPDKALHTQDDLIAQAAAVTCPHPRTEPTVRECCTAPKPGPGTTP